MLRTILSVVALFALAVTPALVAAQDLPPGKWWHEPAIAKRLNLSEEQIKQLDGQFNRSGSKLIGLRSAVQQEQFDLGILLESEKLDEAEIMKQVKKLEAEKSALQEEFMRLVIETRKIIGYENFRILKGHMEKRASKKIRRLTGEESKGRAMKAHHGMKHKGKGKLHGLEGRHAPDHE